MLGLLTAAGASGVNAQSMPPAVVPADAFHQPCVGVRASPDAVARRAPWTVKPSRAFRQPVREQYVDLDNRCASPPAFAPTRDVDSTAVWYVDAPAASVHTTSRRPMRAPDAS
ncbi:hypothetical protein [Pandoraea sp. NPDC087047]|uniref:hypothetical protein n=1 Tax=Pandoraea sp. NPDC087047 TaxID=3364390 RepID=UPI003810FF0C